MGSAEESSATILSSTNGFSHDHLSSINPPAKKKRNLPGNPDPEAEVISLSPKTLMATNRFLCEICGKGFQRDQNLQLHRRGHNLPWKLKQRTSKEIRKRVYVCPEKSCVHHHPSRALGDLTGIKKHFCRKHGEKKWKCEKCAKRYAVQSDWKAHSKTCGTREYKCDCGTLFSRRDSFITHRAFCDALAEETARMNAASSITSFSSQLSSNYNLMGGHNHHHNSNVMNPHFSSMFKPMISSSNQDEQSKLCGLYGGPNNSSSNHSSSSNSPFGSIHELGSLNSNTSDVMNLNHLHQQQQQMQVMYPPLKRQKTFQSSEECGGGGGGGQTRDFLGVGAAVQAALCHPSSINGWI
ncbi:Zinc finger protein MAGPIE [Linum perenne]